MLYQVSQENCDNGVRGAARSCPVALCLMERHPECRISVYPEYNQGWYVGVYSKVGGCIAYSGRIKLPDDVRKRIVLYDDGFEMKPFSFELDLGCSK